MLIINFHDHLARQEPAQSRSQVRQAGEDLALYAEKPGVNTKKLMVATFLTLETAEGKIKTS